MLTWLYPYFVVSACLMGDHTIQHNKSGPYDSFEVAQKVVILMQVNYKCGAYVERDWVWANSSASSSTRQANRHKDELFQKLAEKDVAYQQLMEQAVGLAKILMGASSEAEQYMTGEQFLKSPEVQAWKERKT